MKETTRKEPSEIRCPICHKLIKEYYCTSCGLPKQCAIPHFKWPGFRFNGHEWHTRPELRINGIPQQCNNCKFPNPCDAHYCRNCGENIHKTYLKPRNIDEVIHGGCANDFIQDGGIYKIIDKSCEGFYDERYGKNAVVVIMKCCVKNNNGKIEETGEAFINLSAFTRSAIPYKKKADGFLERDGECVRADGTVVVTWKASQNAKAFMKDNVGKYFTTKLKKKVPVRAWERAAESYSKTELKDQNVYTIDWV